jgi:hypothetical protein
MTVAPDGNAQGAKVTLLGGRDRINSLPLLKTTEMAEFVARGFLRFDALIPPELNARALAELRGDRQADGMVLPEFPRKRYPPGRPLSTCFLGSAGIGQVLALPEVRGIISSLVGPEPFYDHHAVHVRRPGESSQPLHGDAIIDTRAAFDIQLMYYPEDVTAEGGGTLLVPGSHFRQINEQDIARYQNLSGQVLLECTAGTVLVLHHGLWHCGRRTYRDNVRYMVKLRLNPRVDQVRLWDTSDLDDPSVTEQVETILTRSEPWYEGGAARLEQIQRAALFRRLSGEPDFQVEYWLGRLDNKARPRLDELLP